MRGRRNEIKRQGAGDAAAVSSGRIDVAIGIGRVLDELLGGGGKGAAQNRFVNEVDSELESVASCNMAQIVTQLVFLLIAQVGEKSDGRGELVVAEGFESGDGQALSN